MKQLIPQSKIDEAASSFAEQRRLDSRGYPPKIWFESGVQFALNEIQPLVCEFSEWCFDNVIDHDSKSYYIESTQYNVEYSLEQLLEEFIQQKTMKELESLLEFESEEERQKFINSKNK